MSRPIARCQKKSLSETGARVAAKAARPARTSGTTRTGLIAKAGGERPIGTKQDLRDGMAVELVAPPRAHEDHLLVLRQHIREKHQGTSIDEHRPLGNAPDQITAPVVLVEEVAAGRRELRARRCRVLRFERR